jgi:aminoglycoside phosphotransferase (APT) family kinase protein
LALPPHRRGALTIENVLASGRASEIVDLGDGRVLRRFKRRGDPGREAAIMEHALRSGFPVPRVLDVRDDALVLERIEGPTMLAWMRRRPWRIASGAGLLAELHARLHRIPFENEQLVHLDLHPDNVLLSPGGPIVIDWTNARAGAPSFDLAVTWVICATTGGFGGRAFAHFFLRHVDRAEARRGLPDAIAFRIADPSVTDEERLRARRLLQHTEGGSKWKR